MTQADLFKKLGAPLKNVRWSWGSARSGGAVFLRVWQDRTRKLDESWFAQITHMKRFLNEQDNLGYQERQKHVEKVRSGAPCFLIMCVAENAEASPRKVKDFDGDTVFRGGKIIELESDLWIQLLERVPV